MSGDPILVERYAPGQATRIACQECGAETDHNGEGSFEFMECPEGCGGYAEFKYVEADRCPGCGKLGFYEKVLDMCCSRVCQLQAAYARELASRR